MFHHREYHLHGCFRDKGINSKDIYHQNNIGREFISVDMKKANFSSLRSYSDDIFGGAKTWEEFIGFFTESEHIRESKYIREVVLGNCNCKGQIAYEKYLMDQILTHILRNLELKNLKDKAPLVFFSNDEFIFDITDLDETDKKVIRMVISCIVVDASVPLRLEQFKLLCVINETNKEILGYIRSHTNNDVDFKCINNLFMPFVIRALNGESIKEEDKMFEHEGMLAQFINAPHISITETYKN